MEIKIYYSQKINIAQNRNILKISVESPFRGDVTLSIIIITSNFDKYNGYCEFIELYENVKKDVDMMYYGQRFIQKNIYVGEGNTTVDIEVESENILDLNRKNAKVFVINNLNIIDFDAFYNPVSIYINLRDYETELEERNSNIKIFIIIIICIALVCILFIVYRNFQKKRGQNIYNEIKKMKLNDGNISESNKLF